MKNERFPHTVWPFAIRGVLSILFGIVALAAPVVTATALVLVFAAWAFIDGVVALVAAVQRGRAHRSWAWLTFEGLVSLGAGIVAVVYPGLTVLILTLVVAVRALLLGALAIGAAARWKEMPSRWVALLTGIVSIVFGALLVWQPLVGALALIWTIGAYAIVFGVMTLGLAIHIHGQLQGPDATFPSRAYG
ncbi:MAG TPA: HdeD family acid-resistance protein [Polyangiaceae bacterium]|jgi:uncharacterized membrane protein HdeD (DUF308 family)